MRPLAGDVDSGPEGSGTAGGNPEQTGPKSGVTLSMRAKPREDELGPERRKSRIETPP